MRAVIMAGGEGTRLRPLTTNVPKPLLPIVGEPIMGHLLRLLSQHGIDEAVVTVQYLAGLIRSYFGDGSEFGIKLSYATESVPLGTAGSVRNAEKGLRGDDFLVVSGDALTDIDLGQLIEFHKRNDALVTVALARKPNVVEFGNVITAPDGRIRRFVEKPTWGQVLSDTVNTGIYVMRSEVLDRVPPDEVVDWSSDVFPRLLRAGERIFGYIGEAYWEDVGTIESYLSVQRDVLMGRVRAHIGGFEVAPRVWLGEGATVDVEARIEAPCFIGDHCNIERDAIIGPAAVLGSNVLVRRGARIQGSLIDSGAYVDAGAEVNGALVGRATELRAGVHVDPGAVIADQCVLSEEVHVCAGVHVYPAKTIEAGVVVTDNVIWDSQGHRSLFGPRGVSGIVNLDITAEMVVRLAGAYATLLPKGATVTVGRDHSRAARAMNRSLAGSLTAAGLSIRDLRVIPLPIARSDTSRFAQGGVYLRTGLGNPEKLDLLIMDETGANLAAAGQQRIERVLGRRNFRRALPWEIGDIHTPHRVVDEYAGQLASAINTGGVNDAGLKVVVDTGLGAASLVLPRVLSPYGINVLTVNGRLDEDHPTSTEDSYHRAMGRLAELVASSGSDLGVRFDPVGERLSLVDETGTAFDHGRALLVLLDLVAAERHGGVVGLPLNTTRIAESVAAYHGTTVAWAGTSTASLSQLAGRPGLIFAGDGRGGFIVPENGPHVDGIAAFVRLLGLVARTQLTLSAIDARIPRAHLAKAHLPTPWARRGTVMRSLVEAAGARQVSTLDGVRIEEADGSWSLAVPDEVEAVIRVWTEGPSQQRAQQLLAEMSEIIRSGAGLG